MKDGSGKKVVALVVENQEAFATFNVDRFFAVQVLAGVPADGNLGAHQTAPPGGKPELGGDHQGGFVILGRALPL
jgi:hypothetical protein